MFTRDSVVAPFVLLLTVIITLPMKASERPGVAPKWGSLNKSVRSRL